MECQENEVSRQIEHWNEDEYHAQQMPAPNLATLALLNPKSQQVRGKVKRSLIQKVIRHVVLVIHIGLGLKCDTADQIWEKTNQAKSK